MFFSMTYLCSTNVPVQLMVELTITSEQHLRYLDSFTKGGNSIPPRSYHGTQQRHSWPQIPWSGAHPFLIEIVTTNPFWKSKGTAPNFPATLKMCVQPHNVHSLQALQANVIHTWCLATGQLLNHSWSVEFLLHRGLLLGFALVLSTTRHCPKSGSAVNILSMAQLARTLLRSAKGSSPWTPQTPPTPRFSLYIYFSSFQTNT